MPIGVIDIIVSFLSHLSNSLNLAATSQEAEVPADRNRVIPTSGVFLRYGEKQQ